MCQSKEHFGMMKTESVEFFRRRTLDMFESFVDRAKSNDELAVKMSTSDAAL
jgi:hypothetical protein